LETKEKSRCRQVWIEDRRRHKPPGTNRKLLGKIRGNLALVRVAFPPLHIVPQSNDTTIIVVVIAPGLAANGLRSAYVADAA